MVPRPPRPLQTPPDGTRTPSRPLLYDDPREADADAFPADASPTDQLTFMLNWAVRAPSVLNTQPWLFAVDGRLVRLHADRARHLRTLDPDGRALTISCGAALFFLDVAARHFGYSTEAYLQPVAEHPDVLGTLLLAHGGEPSDEDEALFEVIDAGRAIEADGETVDFASLPPHVAARLTRAATIEGVRLHVVSDEERKEAIAALVATGALDQAADRHVQDETQKWLRSAGDRRRDGVPASLRSLWERHAPLRIPPDRVAEHRRGLVEDAPALLVLATETDDAVAWLKAGRALGRLVLTAAAESIPLSYMNQPIEVDALRMQLGDLVGEPYPQLLLGVGITGDGAHGRRRPVREVLLKPQTQEWNWSMV